MNWRKVGLITTGLLLAAGNVWAAGSGVPGIDAPLNGLVAIGANGYGPAIGVTAIIVGVTRFVFGHHKEGLAETGAGGVVAAGTHAAPAIAAAWGGTAAAMITLLPHMHKLVG